MNTSALRRWLSSRLTLNYDSRRGSQVCRAIFLRLNILRLAFTVCYSIGESKTVNGGLCHKKYVQHGAKPFITGSEGKVFLWVDNYRTGSGSDRVEHSVGLGFATLLCRL